MARKASADTSLWPSLRIEGYLIAPAMLLKIANLDAADQKPENYRLRKGISVRDEISTAFRVGQAHYEEYKKFSNINPRSTLSFLQGFFKEVFGYDDLEREDWNSRLVSGESVCIDLVPEEERLDNFVAKQCISKRNSTSLEPKLNDQNYLKSIWLLITNGKVIRLTRDNDSLTRPAHIEADLTEIFDNEDIASFSVLWLLIHRSRFDKTSHQPRSCTLDEWRDVGISEGEVARDKMGGQVKEVLFLLGNGFLVANPEIVKTLLSGEVNITEWFNELLRVVFRITFLLVAEDRNLLHPPKDNKNGKILYEIGYSFKSLRSKCIHSETWNRYHDNYELVKVVFEALSRENGKKELALPALGGLFDVTNLPTLRHSKLPNSYFMKAVFSLTWIKKENAIVPVNWKDMKIEELGSIYESLLDLIPQISTDGTRFYFEATLSNKKGSQRRTTGSYYTSDDLVELVLNSALDPLIKKAKTKDVDSVKHLRSITVIDPACGSGHFLISAAHRIAKETFYEMIESNKDLIDYKEVLRDIIQKCIFGVDINPMAVEIAKFVLWLESLTPGLPLGFLDSQIKCGNSLLGLFNLEVLQNGIPDSAYNPLFGDSKEVSNAYRRNNSFEKMGQESLKLESEERLIEFKEENLNRIEILKQMPEDTLGDVNEKRKFYINIKKNSEFQNVRIAADIYMCAFLIRKNKQKDSFEGYPYIPTTNDVLEALEGKPLKVSTSRSIENSEEKKVFHWPLEFPDVLLEKRGFDVVIGNPPWERVELNELEYFAARNEKIAKNYKSEDRKKLITRLKNTNLQVEQRMYDDYVKENHFSKSLSNFVRTSSNGRFPLSGKGKINTFALFTELFIQLKNSTGAVGLIVPTGLATDITTSKLFQWITNNNLLRSLFDFQNGKKFFKDVHSQFKFSVLDIRSNSLKTEFRFFLTSVSQLESTDRLIPMSSDEIRLFNPNTSTVPLPRTRTDYDLLKQTYNLIPVLVNASLGSKGNLWSVSFSSMFNMSSDSNLFQTRFDLLEKGFKKRGLNWVNGDQLYVPLYEAKMIYQYNHRFSSSETLNTRPFSRPWPYSESNDLADVNYEVMPWYWLPVEEYDRVKQRNQKNYWLAYRAITNATSERTMIATSIFSTALSGKLLTVTTKQSPARDMALLAMLNSLVLDYIVRQKIGRTDLVFHFVKQIPVLPPNYFCETKLKFIVPRVIELLYTSKSMKPFAQELGYEGEPFIWDDDRRAHLRSELDAFYAKAYGLDRTQLRYILDPADVKGPVYPSETFRVLKKNEIKEFGEYRTRKLILDAWDRFESNGTFKRLGM